MTQRTIFLDTLTRKGMALAAINDAPSNWECVLRKRKYKRSLQANAFMWAMLTTAANDAGCTPEEMHRACKERHGGVRKVTVMGVEFEVLNTETSKMTVEEFRIYLDWLQQFLTDNAGIDGRALRLAYLNE